VTQPHSGYGSPRYAWYAVAVLMLANLSGFIDRLILALLVPPIRRDLGLSLTETGLLIGLPFAVFYSLLGLPIARLADSGNRRNIIAAGIALWSIMTAMCALAGTFWRLLLARVGVGVGEATLQAPATSLIADYFPREQLGSAMSVYSMGVFLGSGLAYFIGGWIVGLVSAQEVWTLPLVGSIRPWQTVFLIVGLPGLLIALLMLTVREPRRTTDALGATPLSTLFAYMGQNRRTFTCHIVGFTLSATVNYGIALWLATFLIESHGWPASRAGMVQGVLTMTIGTVGVLAGGRVADILVRRGYSDGPLRVGIIGAAGMLVSATAYPLAGSAAMAVAWLVIVNFFAAFPWGAASAAAAEIVPPALRAQGAAFFYLILNLVSFAVGPWAVGAITDYGFGTDSALPYSLAILNVVGMSGAIALFVIGLPAYRRTLTLRDDWSPQQR
jgi:MFS family permease